MPNVMAALPNIGGAVCSTPQIWLTPTTRVPYRHAVKTRNPLKFAGAQTRQQISAVNGPKFTILWGRVEDILLFKIFFVRWCEDGDFLRHFCVLYFQRAACSTFQSCILNSL